MLERIDELESIGQFLSVNAKDFSKKVLDLSKLVPPIEVKDSMKSLETEINKKWAEMD